MSEIVMIRPLSLRFEDASLEASFAEERARKSLRPIRIAATSAAVLMVAMGLLATFAFPHVLKGGIDLRHGALLMLLILGTIIAATYAPGFVRLQQEALFVTLTAGSASIIYFTAHAPAEIVETRAYIILLIHTFSLYALFGFRLPAAVAAGWGTVAMYVAYLGGGGFVSAAGIARHTTVLALANVWGMLICYQMDAAIRREFLAMRSLAQERERSERLLLNILPATIADRLKASESSIADHCGAVTVLFADIVGFTSLASRMEPHALVDLLNRIFSAFDSLAERHGLEKIKTIGDAYMAVAGVPQPRADHAYVAALMAQDMVAAVRQVAAEQGEPLDVRIGLHSGPVVAGVIGRRKFSYDLWGDTVNVASRIESASRPGRVNLSSETYRLIGERIACEFRGRLEAKGKGAIEMYFIRSGEDTSEKAGDRFDDSGGRE